MSGQKDDADLATRRLAAWCRSCAAGDWSLFGRRLQRDALDYASVLTRLATVRRRPDLPPPTWVEDAQWIEAALQDLSGYAASIIGPDPSDPCAFEDLFAALVAAAVREMRPARFAVGTGACAINVNRRKRRADGSWFGLPFLGQNFEGPVDHTVTVLRFERDDASRAMLINYPCHAVVLGPNVEISADYPGATQRFVEAYFGAGTLALFTNGAEGNLNPIVHPGPFTEVDRLGRILGAEVVKVAEQLTPRPVRRIAAAHRAVRLPVAGSSPLEEEAHMLAAWEARCRTLRASLSPDAVLDEEMSWTTAQLRHLRRRRFGSSAIAEVQYIAIDDAVLASVAGELFTELGRQVRASSPFAHTVLVGLANDSIGYIPPSSCFQEGGFEIEATPLEPGAGEMFRDAMIAGLRALG